MQGNDLDTPTYYSSLFLLSNRAIPPVDYPNTPSDNHQVSCKIEPVCAEEAFSPPDGERHEPIHARPMMR